MNGLGILGDVRPANRFDMDVVPTRPGGAAPLTLLSSGSTAASFDFRKMILKSAEAARDGAIRAVTKNPTPTTLAALAQCHSALNERDEAIDSARRVFDLATVRDSPTVTLSDPVSVRLAADVLVHFDESDYAYEFLREVPRTRSLRLAFSMLAFQAGEFHHALDEIEDLKDPIAQAIKGYFYATVGDYQKAVRHLRSALRDHPDDPDSLLNLSISLWHLGSPRKAILAALRAARVAPGRKDVSMHYMGLLLEQGSTGALSSEIRSLKAQHVVEDSGFLVIQARLLIDKGELRRAIPVLVSAASAAEREGEELAHSEILSNLVALRFEVGRIDRDDALRQLEELITRFPGADSVVVNYARLAAEANRAPLLRSAIESVQSKTTPLRSAYLRHQLAVLEGDNDSAAEAATEWYASEPSNPMAAAAALVAVGIGAERWDDAAVLARQALATLSRTPALVNNASYVLAMAGYGEEAMHVISSLEDGDYVIDATRGLVHLAVGEIEEGMRLYRRAADRAEEESPAMRSLMTNYQALVVRQLGLLKKVPTNTLSAMALAPIDLPSDWDSRPDFLRLHSVAMRNDFDWPLTL